MNPARSDVYPPNVEAIGDMHGCTTEGHAFGCPCGMGGDPIEARCYICQTAERVGMFVEVDGYVRLCCADCWARDEVRVPLDWKGAPDG
jgi:hypothetical protein